MTKRLRLALRRIVGGIKKMNWDIITMGIANIFLPTGMVIALWGIEKNSFVIFLIAIVMIILGTVSLVYSLIFVKRERKRLLDKAVEQTKNQELKDLAFLQSLKEIVNEIRQDRNEYKQSDTNKPTQ